MICARAHATGHAWSEEGGSLQAAVEESIMIQKAKRTPTPRRDFSRSLHRQVASRSFSAEES